MPRCPFATKPDVDNLLKSLFDALTGLLFHDEAQVCDLWVRKCFATSEEKPGVEVCLEWLHRFAKAEWSLIGIGDKHQTAS